MPNIMPRIPPTLGASPSSGPAPLPPPAPASRPRPRFRAVRWLLWLLATPVLASHLLVIALRWLPPPTTAFMLQSPTRPVQYHWVPAEQIASVAGRAVIAAEDQKFRDHGGFDFEAIEKALTHNERSRRTRGASTLSQQVAKNVFLWQGRSWLRKGLEVYATLLIEWTWGKDRILEVYLNVAEFGPGIYGIEAAARHFFGKPAARLTPEEAARLAAVLPSPRRWRANPPGPYVQSRSQWILRQMGFGRPPPSLASPAEAPENPADAPEPPDRDEPLGDEQPEESADPTDDFDPSPSEVPLPDESPDVSPVDSPDPSGR